MKKEFILILAIVAIAVVSVLIYYIIDITSSQDGCSITQCPQGYELYPSLDCGLGPDGPIPCSLDTSKVEECACHKICGYEDVECPPEAPSCEKAIISDMEMYLCFE